MPPAADIAQISARVERLRRLDFEAEVDTRLASRSEVGARFLRGYLTRYGAREAARDARVLAVLRLVPEGTDLRAVATELLSEGVAGFYSPRNDRLFVASASDVPSAYEEVVLAHELGHALVDQALKMPRTSADDPMLADTMLAHQILVEGDATLLMSRYAARRFSSAEYDAFAARFAQQPVAASSIPYFVRRTSELPYYEGLLFACREWLRRGWAGIDGLYRNLPKTTAEVLFPTRTGPAREPPPPSSPGPGWKRVPPRSFGAFDVMLLLENADLLSTGTTVPGRHVDAARGWNGGVLTAWLRGDETAIHLALVDAGVETATGRRRRLCRVIGGWVRETFPEAAWARRPGTWRIDGELAALRCAKGRVELAKGPARAVRRLIAS